MQLIPDYLISDCGCPQALFATEYPARFKENFFPSSNLRFHNYITSSKRRLLPRRESLSDYYDKLLINSTAANVPIDICKKQLPIKGDALKHMKCAVNEAIRKADMQNHIKRSQQSENNLDKKHSR